jgi:hypothetical protein
MTEAGAAAIIVTRARGGWRDIARSYAVMIDGEPVAKVRRGQRLELPITPGRHDVFMKIDWCRSPSVDVDARPGEVIRLSCAPGGSAGAGLEAVLADTQAYIRLTRDE